jgi:hypothetical protein
MNIKDHISGSQSLETIFCVKILIFFVADADPDPGISLTPDPGSGWKKFGFGIWDKHLGSSTLADLLAPIFPTHAHCM